MAGISSSLMMGIMSAQSNIELARQNQALANQTYRAGRIREGQGNLSNNQDAVEEGQEMQAKGKEMESGTFEHLGNAMYNINNIDVDNQSDSYESEDSHDETNQETQSSNYGQINVDSYSEFNAVVRGDTVRGSVNRTISAPRQNSVDISV